MTVEVDAERVKQDLLALSDFAYGRLLGRVEGLTDEEYFWEPAEGCWSLRRTEGGTYRMDGPAHDGPPPLTTIAWRLCHLIGLLAGERNATWIGVTPTGSLERDGEPGGATLAVEQLESAYGLFRAHVAGVEAGTLADAMGPVAGFYAEGTRESFVLHELDELIHHGAEVALIRDLYRILGG